MAMAKVFPRTTPKPLSGFKKPPIKVRPELSVHSEPCMKVVLSAFQKTKPRPSNGIKKALFKEMLGVRVISVSCMQTEEGFSKMKQKPLSGFKKLPTKETPVRRVHLEVCMLLAKASPRMTFGLMLGLTWPLQEVIQNRIR